VDLRHDQRGLKPWSAQQLMSTPKLENPPRDEPQYPQGAGKFGVPNPESTLETV
jgi:hypothetical protein